MFHLFLGYASFEGFLVIMYYSVVFFNMSSGEEVPPPEYDLYSK